MHIVIADADFTDPQLRDFVRAHLDDIAPTAPSDSQHARDLDGLQEPGLRLWVARGGGGIVGTVAVAAVAHGHDELKSMRTDPAFRGHGVGSRLLHHAMEFSRRRGSTRMSLETGSMEFFAPARALYRKHGFVDCGPFGSYTDDPNSTFMTRAL